MLSMRKALAATVLFAFAATGADAAVVHRTYSYYTISGKTAADLDKGLAHGGPLLKSTGQHHPGAAQIRFDAKARYRSDGKACRVTGVYVNVYAKVMLPRWKQRRKATPELALVWDTLAQDIKRHEESHISIAHSHAAAIEREVRALPTRPDCTLLRADINKVTERLMREHDIAQKDFDRVETRNFEKRFERLLTYRLERMLAKGE
jgi:predicted secreted Zn-dependent protease